MRYIHLIPVCCLIMFAVPAAAARKSPVDGGTLTSGPGMRLDPFGSGRMTMHNGWDIAVPLGTPVYPTQDGTVYFAGPYKGYGNLVVVEHGKGVVSLYGHNAELLVQAGQKVTPKTVIAKAGSTGRSTGPHVHYELRTLSPATQKQRQEQLTAQLKARIQHQIDKQVENMVSGQGGPAVGSWLPDDIDE